MTDILNFVAENPWQTFFLGPFAFAVLFVFGGLVFRMINRFLRTIKVVFRGWPPGHLDADGDWRPESNERVSE